MEPMSWPGMLNTRSWLILSVGLLMPPGLVWGHLAFLGRFCVSRDVPVPGWGILPVCGLRRWLMTSLVPR